MNGRGNAKPMICRGLALFMAIALAAPSPCAGSQPAAPPARTEPTARLQHIDADRYPDLFLWRDACNVYVLRDGESAVLVDLGDGDVLDHLDEIGVKRVEWVLLTHHHREQCRGYPRLAGRKTKIAAPAAERRLLEQPNSFRKMKPTLGDRYTVYGSSYVRPPLVPVKVDRALERMDTFEWGGHEIRCIATPGNSPGGMTYMLQLDGDWLAFSADVMLEGARMHAWFDTDWDYGFGEGQYAIYNSAALVRDYHPRLVLPSHGAPIRNPAEQFDAYLTKLRRAVTLYLRGYDVHTYSAAHQDMASRPTPVPFVWRLSPHLLKRKGPNLFANFALVLTDNGHALLVDHGQADEEKNDRLFDRLEARMGLKRVDAMVITHMHGDHFQGAPYLRKRYGTKIWTIDRAADKCARPHRYNYCAMVQSYGRGIDGVAIDRVFRSGETFQWQGYEFTIDWMPGQTEFALCMHSDIDGQKVAFTGDNIFADPRNPDHTGNEALVAHNSAILEEGYIYGARLLKRLEPDLLVGGHGYVMDDPAALIDRYLAWSYEMRDALRALSTDDDYRYWFDPFWVRGEPYRVTAAPGEVAEIRGHVRNFRTRPQTHRIAVHTPRGVTTEPATLEGTLPAQTDTSFPLRILIDETCEPGVRSVAFDVTLDGRRYGPLFDTAVNVANE